MMVIELLYNKDTLCSARFLIMHNNHILLFICVLAWLYWLWCLVFLRIFKQKISVLYPHYVRGKRVFVLFFVLGPWVWNNLLTYLIMNGLSLSSFPAKQIFLLGKCCYIAGIVIFFWYCYKSGVMTFSFPILLLRHGIDGAKEIIEQKSEREDNN